METKPKGFKPPIKQSVQTVVPEKQTQSIATVAQTAVSPYKSAVERMSALPTVSEHLTAERIQGLFAHLLLLSLKEIQEIEQNPNASVLERQIIRLIVKTFRELPQRNYPIKDKKTGEQLLDPKTKKPLFKVVLHPDALQSDKLTLDITKYLQERAFGKPKSTIAIVGADGGPLQVQSSMILAAMKNVNPKALAGITGQKQKAKKV